MLLCCLFGCLFGITSISKAQVVPLGLYSVTILFFLIINNTAQLLKKKSIVNQPLLLKQKHVLSYFIIQ